VWVSQWWQVDRSVRAVMCGEDGVRCRVFSGSQLLFSCARGSGASPFSSGFLSSWLAVWDRGFGVGHFANLIRPASPVMTHSFWCADRLWFPSPARTPQRGARHLGRTFSVHSFWCADAAGRFCLFSPAAPLALPRLSRARRMPACMRRRSQAQTCRISARCARIARHNVWRRIARHEVWRRM